MSIPLKLVRFVLNIDDIVKVGVVGSEEFNICKITQLFPDVVATIIDETDIVRINDEDELYVYVLDGAWNVEKHLQGKVAPG